MRYVVVSVFGNYTIDLFGGHKWTIGCDENKQVTIRLFSDG
jgi:hypothetical protein